MPERSTTLPNGSDVQYIWTAASLSLLDFICCNIVDLFIGRIGLIQTQYFHHFVEHDLRENDLLSRPRAILEQKRYSLESGEDPQTLTYSALVRVTDYS